MLIFIVNILIFGCYQVFFATHRLTHWSAKQPRTARKLASAVARAITGISISYQWAFRDGWAWRDVLVSIIEVAYIDHHS